MKKIAIVLCALALVACTTIVQTVKPVERLSGTQICIVENPAVSQDGFLPAYMQALAAKGYVVKHLPPGSSVTSCTVTSIYTANWQWDFALYMEYAHIWVYRDGQQIGESVYDARRGMTTMSKFIKAETKIVELVDQLFPGRAYVAQ